MSRQLRIFVGLGLIVGAVTLCYLNHFNNGFHFDDRHTILENLFIRDLKFAPKYFTDSSTFSTLPPNQSYRPVVTLSLALDYWLGGGLIPFYFHLSTFLLFLIQLLLMFFLTRKIFSLSDNSDLDRNDKLALFATALYGVHPVCAETVNYIIQRADIQSTVGVIASLLLYAALPRSRKFFVYLIPVTIAMFAKPPAVMIVPILFVYDLLFEQRWSSRTDLSKTGLGKLKRSLIQCFPAGIISAAFYVLQGKLSPTFSTGSNETYRYLITQPTIALHYFKSFFVPTDLSIDAQFELFNSPLQTPAIIGFVFLVILATAILRSTSDAKNYPIAFGLSWFVLALLPTSLIPLAEVSNDHRMFFPFLGLTIAIVWWFGRAIYNTEGWFKFGAVFCLCWLLLFGLWTRERNTTWASAEALWKEAAEKGPRNGRAQMNYGLVLMARGDYGGALALFNKALPLTPNYHSLEINLGVVNAALGRHEESERHFKRAVSLRPELAEPYLFYGWDLLKNKKVDEAEVLFDRAVKRNVKHHDIYRSLLPIYLHKGDFENAAKIRELMREVGVADVDVNFYDHLLARKSRLAVPSGVKDNSATGWLNYSLALYEAGAYEQCIAAAKESLLRDPNSAGAYNNMAAAHNQLGEWDKGIAAARRALEIKPDFVSAAGNLRHAESELMKQRAGSTVK
jgi:tetratricopeptide (TPR) repeat protein